jgi:hypothetical protein
MRRALLLLGLPLLVVACGGGGSKSYSPTTTVGGTTTRSLSAVAAAATKSERAGSFRDSLSMAMSISGRRIEATGEGVYDTKRNRSRMTFDFPRAGGKLEAISDGNTIYTKLPLASDQLPNGKAWLKLDTERLAKQQGNNIGAVQQSDQTDPTQMLHYLETAGSVTKVVTDTVRGVQTTHYRGSIDPRKQLNQASGERRKALEQLIRLTGSGEMPYEAWIDHDGLLRKLTIESKSPKLRSSVRMTMELFDYGVKVDIPLPPADQVTDFGAS